MDGSTNIATTDSTPTPQSPIPMRTTARTRPPQLGLQESANLPAGVHATVFTKPAVTRDLFDKQTSAAVC